MNLADSERMAGVLETLGYSCTGACCALLRRPQHDSQAQLGTQLVSPVSDGLLLTSCLLLLVTIAC